MRVLPILIAIALSGGLFANTANAVTLNKNINRNPATACTLSIPTTNTGVRPRATGFRNEGTVSNFVICGFDIESSNESFLDLVLDLASIDGNAHTVSCTAMDRYAYNTTGDFVTKSVSIAPGGDTNTVWSSADFPTTGLAGWNASVTCNVPPGVSIVVVQAHHDTEVGN